MAKNKFKAIIGIIFAAAVFFAFYSPVKAEGLRLELGQGQCQQNRGGKGSWWNDRYRTFLDLNDKCYQVGLSTTPWRWRGNDVGIRFAYVDLGRVRINSNMAARDDDQLSNPSGKHCNWSKGGKGCLINVSGGGHPRGFSAGAVIERDVGGMMLGAEAGGFVYYNHFTVAVTAYPDASKTPGWWWYRQWDLARGWQVSPYLGANVRYGYLYASARVYSKIVASCREDGCKTFNGGSSGVTNGEAWQINVGLSIPLTR